MSLSYQFSNFLLKCVTYELALVANLFVLHVCTFGYTPRFVTSIIVFAIRA